MPGGRRWAPALAAAALAPAAAARARPLRRGCKEGWWAQPDFQEASGASSREVGPILSQMRRCGGIADATAISAQVDLPAFLRRHAGRRGELRRVLRRLDYNASEALEGSGVFVTETEASLAACVPLACYPQNVAEGQPRRPALLLAGLWRLILWMVFRPERPWAADEAPVGALRLHGADVPELEPGDLLKVQRLIPVRKHVASDSSAWRCGARGGGDAAVDDIPGAEPAREAAYRAAFARLAPGRRVAEARVEVRGPPPPQGRAPQVSRRAGAVLCAIPKNGWSAWTRFLRRLEHERDWYNLNTGDALRHTYPRDRQEASRLFNDPSLLKVVFVRNPITRLLSAWLSKSEDPSEWHSVFFTESFSEFVGRLRHDAGALMGNDHFVPQMHFCDLSAGARYDVVAKVEERWDWAGPLFEHLNLTRFASQGWGAYITPCYVQGRTAGDRLWATPSLDPNLRGERLSIWRGGRHFLQAPFGATFTAWRLRAHYGGETTFCTVAWLYRRDIRQFGYTAEVLKMYRTLFPVAARKPGARGRCLACGGPRCSRKGGARSAGRRP